MSATKTGNPNQWGPYECDMNVMKSKRANLGTKSLDLAILNEDKTWIPSLNITSY